MIKEINIDNYTDIHLYKYTNPIKTYKSSSIDRVKSHKI